MPLSLSHDSHPPLSLSYPLPPPTLSHPSARCQGWIRAFISTIQPRCFLATEHGSFNCPCILCFIHPVVTCSMPTAFIHIFSAFLSTSEAFKLSSGSWWAFPPLLRLSGLQHSNNISATLEADRQAGEAFLSGCVTPGSSRCTHTHTHTCTINVRRQGLALGLKGPRRIN